MNLSNRRPLARPLLPLLGFGMAIALLSGCHKSDDAAAADTATPAASDTMMPDTSMPAQASTMAMPMPASTDSSYDQGTSNQAPMPSSMSMPPPTDSNTDTGTQDQGSDSTANPSTPADSGH